MAALAGLIAHGGTGGAVVEALVVLLVIAVLAVAWLREGRTGKAAAGSEARLRDHEPGS